MQPSKGIGVSAPLRRQRNQLGIILQSNLRLLLWIRLGALAQGRGVFSPCRVPDVQARAALANIDEPRFLGTYFGSVCFERSVPRTTLRKHITLHAESIRLHKNRRVGWHVSLQFGKYSG